MNSISWQPIAAYGRSEELPSRTIIKLLSKEVRRLSSPTARRRGSSAWIRLESARCRLAAGWTQARVG